MRMNCVVRRGGCHVLSSCWSCVVLDVGVRRNFGLGKAMRPSNPCSRVTRGWSQLTHLPSVSSQTCRTSINVLSDLRSCKNNLMLFTLQSQDHARLCQCQSASAAVHHYLGPPSIELESHQRHSSSIAQL